MPVKMTQAHAFQVMWQLTHNLRQLQRDIALNARSWKMQTSVPTKTPEELARLIDKVTAEFQRRLSWFDTAQGDAELWPRVMRAWSAQGGTLEDLVEPQEAMRAAVATMSAAGKSTHSSIAAACDALLAAVDMPVSLWPEE